MIKLRFSKKKLNKLKMIWDIFLRIYQNQNLMIIYQHVITVMDFVIHFNTNVKENLIKFKKKRSKFPKMIMIMLLIIKMVFIEHLRIF